MKEYYDAVVKNNEEKINLSPERIESLNYQMEALLLHGISKINVGKRSLNIMSSFYDYNIKRRLFCSKKSLDFSDFAAWVEEKQKDISGMLAYIALNEEEAAEYIRKYQDEDKLAWFCYALLNIHNVMFEKIYDLLHFAAKYHPQGVSAQTMKDFFTREIALNLHRYPSENFTPYSMWQVENFNSVPLPLRYRVACAISEDDKEMQKITKSIRYLRIWLLISVLFAVYLVCAYFWVSPSNITLKMINLFMAIIFCCISYGLYRKFKL